MQGNNERIVILEMLKEGKITAAEAESLLSTLIGHNVSEEDDYGCDEDNDDDEEEDDNEDDDDYEDDDIGLLMHILYESEHEKIFELDSTLQYRIDLICTNGGITISTGDQLQAKALLKAKVRAENAEVARETALDKLILHVEPGHLFFDASEYKHFNESLSIDLILPREMVYNIHARSVNGGVALAAAECNVLEVKTVNGGIRVVDVKAETAKLDSTNGGIRSEIVGSENIRCSSTNGTVAMLMNPMDKGVCELKTVNGTISVRIKDAINAAYDLDLRNSIGSIKVDLPNIKQSSHFSAGKRNEVKLISPNNDDHSRVIRIVASAINGNITIQEQD